VFVDRCLSSFIDVIKTFFNFLAFTASMTKHNIFFVFPGLMRSNLPEDNNGRPMMAGPSAALQEKQKSFMSFGFSADPPTTPGIVTGGLANTRRESQGPNVNVTPTAHDMTSDTPEIRKYKKRFNSEILCAALWGVNLLIGTENGLMLLDRSGQVCTF
jgi:hypothetical protein